MTLDNLNDNKKTEEVRLDAGPKRTPYSDGSYPQGRAKPIGAKEVLVQHRGAGNTSNSRSEVREISSYDIAPPAPQKALNEDLMNSLMGDLDIAVEKEKKRITQLQDELIQSGIEQMEDERANAAIIHDNEEDSSYYESNEDNREVQETTEYVEDRKTNISIGTHNDYELDGDGPDPDINRPVTISRSIEDDLADELNENDEENIENDEYNEAVGNDEEETKNVLEGLKKEIKGIVTPIRQKLDLNKFTIVSKAKSVQDVLSMVTSDIKTAEWILPHAKTHESFIPLSALDIINLDPQNHTKSRLNTFRQIYKIMYDHIVTPGKPDFEKWLRVTLFHDIDNIYFGLYLATFRDSAFINLSCEKASKDNRQAKGCGHQFIEEHNPMDYVKFANDDEKKKFEKIMNKDNIKDDSYNVTLVQISDDYAIGLRMPSIYNVVLETASLTQEFLNKH